jgi:hypothetical protein
MTEVTVRRYIPPFKVDLAGVRVIDDDYAPADVVDIIGVPRVHDATVELRRMAPDYPTLAFACDPSSARALAAHFRLAGLRAEHVDNGQAVDVIRSMVAELTGGRLNVLVSCGRLAGRQPISDLRMVALLTPTRSPLKHQRYLGRLDPSAGELAILDIVDSVGVHGLPAGWAETVIVGPASEVVRDPMIEKITAVPHKDAMRWAGKNIDRLVLIQRAKNFKPGWTYNTVKSFDPSLADRWWRSQKSS